MMSRQLSGTMVSCSLINKLSACRRAIPLTLRCAGRPGAAGGAWCCTAQQALWDAGTRPPLELYPLPCNFELLKLPGAGCSTGRGLVLTMLPSDWLLGLLCCTLHQPHW